MLISEQVKAARNTDVSQTSSHYTNALQTTKLNTFEVYRAVHRNIIPIVKPTR